MDEFVSVEGRGTSTSFQGRKRREVFAPNALPFNNNATMELAARLTRKDMWTAWHLGWELLRENVSGLVDGQWPL